MKYSSSSANWLGMQFSTVVGRLRMTLVFRRGVKVLQHRLQISTAASISVPMKDSGEYSYRRSIPAMTGWAIS